LPLPKDPCGFPLSLLSASRVQRSVPTLRPQRSVDERIPEVARHENAQLSRGKPENENAPLLNFETSCAMTAAGWPSLHVYEKPSTMTPPIDYVSEHPVPFSMRSSPETRAAGRGVEGFRWPAVDTGYSLGVQIRGVGPARNPAVPLLGRGSESACPSSAVMWCAGVWQL